MKNNNTLAKRGVALGLAGVLSLGAFNGIGAYFTSTSSASDTYTIGKVEIEMSGSSNDFAKKILLPLEEYNYQREVTNIGLNSAYVYMTVSVPYVETETVNKLDGTISEQTDYTQVLTYGYDGAAGVSSKFKLVENGRVGDISIDEVASHSVVGGSEEKGAVDEDHKCITYVYAYVDEEGKLAPLAKNSSTGFLFDTMKVANLADSFNMKEYGSVLMNAYAIQTNNILTDEKFAGSEEDGTTDIEEVWSVIQNACAVPTVPYNMLNAQNVVPGEVATFRSEADLGKLVAVYIDGNLIDESNYEASEGSTIITFSADFTETLDLGAHMLEVKSANGSAYHEFTVADVDIDTPAADESYILTNKNDGAQQSKINIAGVDYRVLAVEDGKAFLMQDKVDANWNSENNTQFSETDSHYGGSNLDAYLEGTLYEQLKAELGENAIAETVLTSDSLSDGQSALTRHVYALSRDEVFNTTYGFGDENAGWDDEGLGFVGDSTRVALDENGDPASWWLRSAARDIENVYRVTDDGYVNRSWYDSLSYHKWARAAFWLNLNEVEITGENHQYTASKVGTVGESGTQEEEIENEDIDIDGDLDCDESAD